LLMQRGTTFIRNCIIVEVAKARSGVITWLEGSAKDLVQQNLLEYSPYQQYQ
jgi:hypothetical protein